MAAPELSVRHSATPKKTKCDNGTQVGESGPKIFLRPIGTARSPFDSKRGVPRQALLAASLPARIELDRRVLSADSLEGLADFSHAWIIFQFNLNTQARKVRAWRDQTGATSSTFPPKVAPPLLHGEKTGVFGCRSPHRPNPIGLSLVRLERVEAQRCIVHVRGLDLVDGTPIIDIKPFCPSDQPDDTATYPNWLFEVGPSSVVNETLRDEVRVEFRQDALDQLRTVLQDRAGDRFFLTSEKDAVAAFTDVLKLDVRGVHQGRGRVTGEREQFSTTLDGLRCTFIVVSGDNESEVGARDTDTELHPLPVARVISVCSAEVAKQDSVTSSNYAGTS